MIGNERYEKWREMDKKGKQKCDKNVLDFNKNWYKKQVLRRMICVYCLPGGGR